MSEYNMPAKGLFGKRCRIKNVHDMDKGFVYRIVNSGIRSNYWKEPPLGGLGKNVHHDHCEEILIVVCDTLIDDTAKLERVALKDVKIMDEGSAEELISEGKYTRPCKGFYFDGSKRVDFDNAEFHGWGSDYQEFEEGPGNYTIAIIELANGKVITTAPEYIEFTDSTKR